MQVMFINDWEQFKTLIASKSLLLQYRENASVYELFAVEAQSFLWNISLLKGSLDAIDFETNYKINCNKPLDYRNTNGVIGTTLVDGHISGEISDNATATVLKPIVIGAQHDDGKVYTLSTENVFNYKSLHVISLPVHADLGLENKLYGATCEFILPTGDTETAFIYFKNPTTSGKTIYVDDLLLDVLTKTQQATFRMYTDPTVTNNGIIVAGYSTHVGGGAAASSIQVFSAPTVTINGVILRVFSAGMDANSLAVPINFGTVLEPGHSILFTGQPTADNVSVVLTMQWAEI